MFDLAKLVSDIYVCGNFHCCIIFLSTAPIRPGYAISYFNCGLSIVVEIKITARKDRKKEDTAWEKEKDISDLSYLQSKAEDWVQQVR